MLNFIYYPISAVIWFWREVLSFFGLSPHAGITWLLAIVLMTMTVKALLVYPTVKSLRSTRRMQEIAPKLQEVRERYKNDQAKMAEETRKVYKESGFNPVSGCLPMFVQLPVFIGIFHVIRSFNRTSTSFGQPGMSPEVNRTIPNYMFSAEDVQSFLDARIFGVPLSASIGMPAEDYQAFQPVDFTRLDIAMVAVPFIVLVVVFTHLNARYSLNRQKDRQASGKTAAPTGDNAAMLQMQQNMMGKMMLWVMPAMTIVTGYIWPIGLLSYFLTNTLWTFIQTRTTYKIMDREEEEREEERRQLAVQLAPQPGARKADRRSKAQRKADAERQRRHQEVHGNQAQAQAAADDEAKKLQLAEEQARKDRQAAERARSQAKKKKNKRK